jgi:hypothetical protein
MIDAETKRGPLLRVRVNHDRTSAGWRLKETTVEIIMPLESEGDPNYLRHILESEMYAAHQSGVEEANRRNAQETRHT